MSYKRAILNRVIEENLDGLMRFAFFQLRSRALAEDLVQEAVVRALANPPSSFLKSSVKSYLFRILYNLCHDALREKKNEDFFPIHLSDQTEDDSLDMEEAERLYGLLQKLNENERDIIRMKVIDGLSFAEISRIMEIPQSTIKYRYKTGMDKLRKLFLN